MSLPYLLSARVGVVDRIFTRLVSQESIRLRQSTFMIDLSQVQPRPRQWAGWFSDPRGMQVVPSPPPVKQTLRFAFTGC
jgi:hypothetical protein